MPKGTARKGAARKTNKGSAVSSVARSTASGPGKGAAVSAVARRNRKSRKSY